MNRKLLALAAALTILTVLTGCNPDTGKGGNHSHPEPSELQGDECAFNVASIAPGVGTVIAHIIAQCFVKAPRSHHLFATMYWTPDVREFPKQKVGYSDSVKIPRPGREVDLTVTSGAHCVTGFYYLVIHARGRGGPGFKNFDTTENTLKKGVGYVRINSAADCI